MNTTNANAWLLIFSDLLILLLTMFVLRLSMSTFETEVPRQLPVILEAKPDESSKEPSAFLGSDISLHKLDGETLLRLGASNFTSEDGSLSFKAAETISTLIKGLKNRNTKVRIEAHCNLRQESDSLSSSNWKRSQMWGMKVARQIIDANVDSTTLSLIAYGELKPIFSNSYGPKVHPNGRVDVYLKTE